MERCTPWVLWFSYTWRGLFLGGLEMSKDPAVLFYTSDFLTGTAYFTDEQRGQYIRLLCEQHQNGHIPENHMITICFSLGSPVVKKFVKDEEGNYYNERMEEEILKRSHFIETRYFNGVRGGRPLKPNSKPNALANNKPTDNLSGNGNDNDNINRKRKSFKVPTIEEVRNFFAENGFDPDFGETRWHYYNDADWFDSKGNPVLNWKQKMRSVWFKDEHKPKPAQRELTREELAEKSKQYE